MKLVRAAVGDLSWYVLLALLAVLLAACGSDVTVEEDSLAGSESGSTTLVTYRWYDYDPSPAAGGAAIAYTHTTRFTPSLNLSLHGIRYMYGDELVLYRDSDNSLYWSQAITPTTFTLATWYQYDLPTPVSLSAGETYYVGVYSATERHWYAPWPAAAWSDGTIDEGFSWVLPGAGFPVASEATWDSFVNIIYSK